MSYITKEQILSATNGGLEIILSYYPQAEKCIYSQAKFKIRQTEKTPLASIKQLPNGWWVVTDFGLDATVTPL